VDVVDLVLVGIVDLVGDQIVDVAVVWSVVSLLELEGV